MRRKSPLCPLRNPPLHQPFYKHLTCALSTGTTPGSRVHVDRSCRRRGRACLATLAEVGRDKVGEPVWRRLKDSDDLRSGFPGQPLG